MTTVELVRVNDQIDFIHQEIATESAKLAPDDDLLENLYSDLDEINLLLESEYRKTRINEIGLRLV